MRNILKDKIEYYEDGEVKELNYSIVFVSNRINREFTELLSKVNKLRQLKKQYDDCISECGIVIAEHKEGYKKELKELTTKKDILEKKMADKCDEKILEQRFDLVTRLLKDNGNKEEKFYSYEFWDEHVEPYEMMSLLSKAIYKDVNSKTLGEAKK